MAVEGVPVGAVVLGLVLGAVGYLNSQKKKMHLLVKPW